MIMTCVHRTTPQIFEPTPCKPAFTYFIEEGGRIKVGVSFNPQKRISNISKHLGIIKIRAIVPQECIWEARELEKATLERLGVIRLNGEWCLLDENMERWISLIARELQ